MVGVGELRDLFVQIDFSQRGQRGIYVIASEKDG